MDDMPESESIIRKLRGILPCMILVGSLETYTQKKAGRSLDESREAVRAQDSRLQARIVASHRLPRAFCPIKTRLTQLRTVRTGQSASAMIL